MYIYIYIYRWDRAYFKTNVAKTEDELKADIEEKKIRNAAEMQKKRDAKNVLKQVQIIVLFEIMIGIYQYIHAYIYTYAYICINDTYVYIYID
jgi:uncharacterized membrane protein